MGTVRTIAGKIVLTHYFSTQYETEKYVRKGAGTGWYYQLGTERGAEMKGPFRLLEDLTAAIPDER